jgi:CheY-like chemotaxis protein
VLTTNNTGSTAGDSPTTSFTVTADSTGPASVSISHSNGPSGAVVHPVTFSQGTDGGGSGVASWILERAYAAFTTGTTCPAGPATAYAGIGGASPASVYADDFTGETNGCYWYRLTSTDAVGNASAVTVAAPFALNQTGPTLLTPVDSGNASQSSAGNPIYVKGGSTGVFRVAVPATGFTSTTFPAGPGSGLAMPATTVSGAGQVVGSSLVVADTTGFISPGQLTAAGLTGTCSYTGITSGTTFTGVTGCTGTATNGGAVAPLLAITSAATNPGTLTGSYFVGSGYVWTAGYSGDQTLTFTQNPGAQAATVHVVADSTAPSTSDTSGAVSPNPRKAGDGAAVVTLTPTDGGAGVRCVYYTTDGSAPTFNADCTPSAPTQLATPSGGTVTVTLPTSDGTYTVKYRAVDNVGNAESTKTATAIVVDSTAPAVGTPTLATATAATLSGASSPYTVHFSPTLNGSFTVNLPVTDTPAGPQKVNFPAVGAVTGWTHANQDVTGASPYVSAGYSWTGSGGSPAGTPANQTLTAYDTAGNTSTITLHFVADSAAPATTDNPATIANAWRRIAATVTLSPADTGGSGLAQTYYTTDGITTPTTGSSTGTSISLSAEGTYTIKYFSVDNVGNTEAVQTGVAQIRIDTTAPPTPSLTAITTPSLNGASLSLTGAVVDTGGSNGVTVSYLYCAGAGAGCGSPTTIGTSSTVSPYTITWSSQPADGQYTVFARATDAAGNVSSPSTPQTINVDNVAPVISIASGPATPTSSTSATFTFTTSESATFECNRDGGGFLSCTNPVTFTPLASGVHTFQVRAHDVANNVSNTVTYASWTVDTVAPSGTFAPAGSASGTVALTATATDAGGVGVQSVQFQVAPSVAGVPGAWTNIGAADTTVTYSASWATGPANSIPNGDYFLQAIATDLAGNSAAVTAPVAVTVSNTPKALLTASIGTAGTPLALLYNGQIDTGTPPPASAFTVLVGGAPRTVTGVTFGFDTVYLALATPVLFEETVTVSYTVPSGPAVPLKDLLGFDLAALVGQGVGNSSTFGLAPPVLASSTPVDGSLVAGTGLAVGTITYTADKIVTWSGISFSVPAGAPAAPAFTAPVGTTATATYGSTVPGEYQFTATLNDGVNPAVNIASHFTIAAPAGAVNPPATSKSGDAATAEQLQSSDGTGSLGWQAGTFLNPVVVSLTPVISATTPSASRPATMFGLSSAITTGAIEVKINNLSDGSPVTSFPASNPLEIIFENGTDDAVPVLSSDGGLTYRDIPRIPGPGLPAGTIDGYWFDAATRKLHILTTHLTIFAVQRDTQPPSAPRSLSGVIAGDGLTLRWEPASDNSGSIAHYHLFVNGERIQTFGGVTFEGKLGPYTPGDTRVFQVRADDSRGNLGESSNAVTLLPDISGLTATTARGVLIRSGLSIGTTTQIASGAPAGTIVTTTPAYPAVVTVGGTVGVAVSSGTTGGTSAPLVLKVAGAKRIALRQRRTLALRVVVSLPALTTITLRTATGTPLATWKRTLSAGATIITVDLPQTARRAGTFKFTVTARPASAPKAKATSRTTIVSFSPAPAPAKAVDVVLINGPAVKPASPLQLPKKATVQHVATARDVYDVSATRAANVQVVVVDLDTKGLDTAHFVRNLRAVYPDLRIVALASTAAQVDQARREGATIVLTKPVSVEILSSVVTDLIPTTTPDTRATAAVRQRAEAAQRAATGATTATAAKPRARTQP